MAFVNRFGLLWIMVALLSGGALFGGCALLGGCALFRPYPGPVGPEERLRALPTAEAPLSAPATIYYDDHLIPFIEAATDDDLAFCLGLVQAHLRLAQMEIFRLASQGRLSEMAGPFMTEADKSIRILGLDRAVDEIEKNLPPETKRWLDRYIAGINHYLTRGPRPPEFGLLGLKRRPWTARDVLILGRLFGADVNWLTYFRLLSLRNGADWNRVWSRAEAAGERSRTSFTAAALFDVLQGMSRSGSNSVVVSAARSAGGGAMILSDPHVGQTIPNMWLIVGAKSPSYHLVGLTAPGLPAWIMGRNEHLAWGGTNMRAASSDLLDVSSGNFPITMEEQPIKVRWWFDDRVKVRLTELGPIITDAPLLKDKYTGPDLALRWVGHWPSDELTAILRANRACDWGQFRRAWSGYAVGGQNITYADDKGNIGQIMAVALPDRHYRRRPDLVLDPADPKAKWTRIVGPEELPAAFNPADGYLASANNRPTESDPPAGFLYTANARIRRLNELLSGNRPIGLDDLKKVHLDVTSPAARELTGLLLELIGKLSLADRAPELVGRLRDWDCSFRAASRGPVAFTVLTARLARGYYGSMMSEEAVRAVVGSSALFEQLAVDLSKDSLAEEGLARIKPILARALNRAAEDETEFDDWGQMHRLKLNHFLGRVPLIGRRYRYLDLPADGFQTTLLKTSHPVTTEKHASSYGSTARHISDLSDPNANYFLLLGGQDGWLGSTAMLDQVPLWREGRYIQVPLDLDLVRATFSRRVVIGRK